MLYAIEYAADLESKSGSREAENALLQFVIFPLNMYNSSWLSKVWRLKGVSEKARTRNRNKG